MVMFELMFALSTYECKEVRVLAGPFQRSKILWYAQNFQWVQNFIFPNRRHLIHHITVEMWPASCKFPVLFSAAKLKL